MSNRMFAEHRPQILLTIVVICLCSWSSTAQGSRSSQTARPVSNTLEGTILDESRNPVVDAFVEVYSNTGSMIAHQRSMSSGRYVFRGLPEGRFTIKVRPFGTNLKEGTEDVELSNVFSTSETQIINFRLERDKRFDDIQPSVVSTVFAQDVPDEARRLYKSGIDNIRTNHDKALSDLADAIRIFPTYFDALAALGKAYILDGKYEQGYPFLIKAINVNGKCGDCFYSLALTLYKAGQISDGVRAVNAATMLEPQVPAIRLLQGMLLFLNSDLAGAEKALLTAKSLFKEPDADVYWYLSLIYNKTKRNKEAADSLEQYLKAKSGLSQTEKERIKDLIGKLRKSAESQRLEAGKNPQL